MADTLESLEIEVKHKSSGAQTEIAKVTAQIESMGKALSGVLPQLREYAETISKVGSSIRSGGAGAGKKSNPLSEEMKATIASAGKYEIAVHKAATAEVQMGKAFKEGNENDAWKARERALNATAQATKYAPKDELKEAGNAAKEAAKGVKSIGDEAKKTKKPLDVVIQSLARIAFYRAVRTVIKEIADAFREGLQVAYIFSSGITTEGHRFAEAMDNMKASTNQMKGQLGSAFIALYAAIAPILIAIINLVTKVANVITQLLSAFTGTTYLKANKTASKFADTMAAGGAAAAEWRNQLLGFDEINRLEAPSDSGGGGGADNPLKGFDFEDTPLDDWAMRIHNSLAAIEFAASGFALAIGLLLTLSGVNIPLGLGLIAIGAMGMASALKEDWSTVDPLVAKTLSNVMAIVGGAFLGLGAILAFSGANVPLGIGLMAAGAAALGTAIAINWKAIPNDVANTLSTILLAAGAALLALGLVIMFATPAFSPLGLGLIVAGAVGLAAGAAINWDWARQKIGAIFGNILAIIGGALEVLGILLCLTGVGAPLGLALIWAGMKASHAALSFSDSALVLKVKALCDSVWQIVNGLFGGIHDWIQNILDGLSTFISGLSGIANSNASNIMANGSIYLEGFASGGYPDSGQLFVARESGAEMVGTIGGRTTVATNDDIVAGIRQGVYEAVSAAMGGGSNDVNVKVYLDSREIKVGQNRLNRAMGV